MASQVVTAQDRPRIVCRQIAPSDREEVIALLHAGFPSRARPFWEKAWKRLAEHATPPGFPTFGYLLHDGVSAVGVLLMISTTIPAPTGEPTGAPASEPTGARQSYVRCNVSSWYVVESYRAFAAQLAARALSHKTVSYLNVSPAPSTQSLLQAQGYTLYCQGHVLAAPALIWGGPKVTLQRVTMASDDAVGEGALTPSEQMMLRDHVTYGCLCLLATVGARTVPLVFQRRSSRGFSHARLIYARDINDFVTYAGPVGRVLALHGAPLVLINANGPIPGLPGRFLPAPKYVKGPCPPLLADLTYTEYAMFGV